MNHRHHMMHGMDIGHCQCSRHFLTKEEQLEHLKTYKEWLANEQKGVEEAIKELE